uniref:Uncharacterized protein n=1 Tax=Globodera rostochiensis TaxID=31243 RepID=A0A914I9W4_GLORO
MEPPSPDGDQQVIMARDGRLAAVPTKTPVPSARPTRPPARTVMVLRVVVAIVEHVLPLAKLLQRPLRPV